MGHIQSIANGQAWQVQDNQSALVWLRPNLALEFSIFDHGDYAILYMQLQGSGVNAVELPLQGLAIGTTIKQAQQQLQENMNVQYAIREYIEDIL
jgi:hypothetical protein